MESIGRRLLVFPWLVSRHAASHPPPHTEILRPETARASEQTRSPAMTLPHSRDTGIQGQRLNSSRTEGELILCTRLTDFDAKFLHYSRRFSVEKISRDTGSSIPPRSSKQSGISAILRRVWIHSPRVAMESSKPSLLPCVAQRLRHGILRVGHWQLTSHRIRVSTTLLLTAWNGRESTKLTNKHVNI